MAFIPSMDPCSLPTGACLFSIVFSFAANTVSSCGRSETFLGISLGDGRAREAVSPLFGFVGLLTKQPLYQVNLTLLPFMACHNITLQVVFGRRELI